MNIDDIKDYEGKEVVMTIKGKDILIGIFDVVENKVVFRPNSVHIFLTKEQHKMTHNCPIIMPVSVVREIREKRNE